MEQVELEICANCKREIPHFNYVMHTAHCARNISLCSTCREPIPKGQYEEHKRTCIKKSTAKPQQPLFKVEKNKYIAQQRSVGGMERLVDSGDVLERSRDTQMVNRMNGVDKTNVKKAPPPPRAKPNQHLLPCQYCELELPKFDLGEHENYCGARTEKCPDCGELVLYKYRQLHQDTNHGFLKLNDEPGPKATWDSSRRVSVPESPTRPRFRPFTVEDIYSPVFGFASNLSGNSLPSLSTTNSNGEKLETSREISRRLDCKTEYIRNLLHDSASITAPIRSTGTVPRHLGHNKGPAPQPPRRRNPPTELLIPCEFCNTPIPHEELIEHETGCRPDLARMNSRPRGDSPDYFIAPEPSSPDVELPCEFCADLIPASRLLSHQSTCN